MDTSIEIHNSCIVLFGFPCAFLHFILERYDVRYAPDVKQARRFLRFHLLFSGNVLLYTRGYT